MLIGGYDRVAVDLAKVVLDTARTLDQSTVSELVDALNKQRRD